MYIDMAESPFLVHKSLLKRREGLYQRRAGVQLDFWRESNRTRIKRISAD
jgi:hypothetical protein